MAEPDREPVPEFIMIPRGGLLIRHKVPPGVDTNEKLLAWAASLVKAHEVDSLLAEHRKADPAFPDSPLAGLVTAAVEAASHCTQERETQETGDRPEFAGYGQPLRQGTGNVPSGGGAGQPAGAESPTRPRVEPLKVTVKRRLEADGRWKDVEPVRDQMMREARAGGMTKEQAQEWTYSELDRLYPPPETQTPHCDAFRYVSESGDLSPLLPTKPISESVTDSGQIQGLSDLPGDWPKLPANASMAVELAWVQANRLRLVTERPGRATVVDLSQAISPAPSWGALGWLETSIYSKAKFVEALVKVGGGDDEGESAVMKRERRAVDEVRALLKEMEDAEGTCPHCGRAY